MSGTLDTNLVLRWLLGDVPDQAHRVSLIIESGKVNSLRLPDAVLFECVWVLEGDTYGFDRGMIADLLTQLTRVPQIDCSRTLIEQLLPIYVEHPILSFIDVYLAAHAKINRALPLLTYDKKLAKTLPELVQLVA